MQTTDGPRTTPCVERRTEQVAREAETKEPDQTCDDHHESVPEEAGYGYGV